MKVLVGNIIGIVLAIAGQAAAQYFESYDNQGNGISGYSDSTGNEHIQHQVQGCGFRALDSTAHDQGVRNQSYWMG
jgi:hypothetical protein